MTRHSQNGAYAGLPVWARIALRELRGGLGGFKIFIACLVIGVATIAAVGTLTKSIEDSLAREGQTILGGDIEIGTGRKTIPQTALTYLKEKGTLITTSRMPTMARSMTSGEATMVDLRAVGEGYPLYGRVETVPQQEMGTILAQNNAVFGVAIEELLADRLQLKIGDKIKLGTLQAEVRSLIISEPDKANLGFQLGPTVMISNAGLQQTGLVQYGSLIGYAYKLRLQKNDQQALTDFRTNFKEAFPDTDWRVRDRTNSAPGLRRFIERMGMFLTLVGLTALIVGGVGVGNAVKGYMDFKTRTIATLKILGASGSTIFKVYFAQILIIGLISIGVGLVVGSFLPQLLVQLLPDNFPIEAHAGIYTMPLVLAALYGLLVTTAFTAWPLGVARDLPPVRLFREQVEGDRTRPRATYLALIIASAITIVMLSVGMSDRKMIAAGFMAGAVGSLLLLRLTSWLIEKIASKLPKTRKPLLRLAIANIHRPGAATGPVTISLGLGLTLFSALALIEGNLDAQVQEQVPERAPSFFFMDIQKSQIDGFKEDVLSVDGISDLETVANLRGRVIKFNGADVDMNKVGEGFRWIVRGDRGITYLKELPLGSDVVKGSWWPEDYQGQPEISIGEREAAGLGLDIGDTVTFNILGREITATIRSIRKINWSSMGFNFVFIFDPYTLSVAPHTLMATVKTTNAEAERTAHRLITKKYENVSVIRMKEILQKLNDLLSQMSVAIKGTALIAILSGILVLAGAIAAGFRQRVYESVILKVVGAVRSQILKAYILEYLMVGLIVALIALALGGLAGYVVVTQVWQMQFTWLPVPIMITLATSLVVTLGFGLMGSFRALAVSPNSVLRNE
ncbi:FtsX-like permease family protein [Temperatibacter marinus]|uniref:FtsX-like permease family protein n=1 Tax=Temperatibacter marinus TaxID=1456591 RepID=A0AA52EGS4_9PROT|nr:FtsX-like permease family protein [Temperatibacter marinus]WND03373.1 FtsX-like permease family protein [Temperatibacter marinus]